MRPKVVVLAMSLATCALPAVPADAHPIVLGKPAAKKGKDAPPPTVDKKVKLSPDGLQFGMTLEEISKLYEKVLDAEFVPLYQNTEPGPRMNELDTELADKKQLVMRNKVEFGSLPSGLENTALAGEFTYNNGETMTQFPQRSGVRRYLFFFGNHLWKVYDVHKLGKKSKMGADYAGAVDTLTKELGKPPRVRKADPSAGRPLDTADWQDKETIVRLTDRGDGSAALSYIDRKIEENIDKFRPNKGPAKEELDRDVSDVTKHDGDKTDDKNANVTAAYAKKKKN
ncbi:MAG TPA: hypothetical protein VHC69_24225 [Polyangiaceae bacterium]|nr:hypothetical protein [Polyangiaceae bacterium]